MFSPPGYRPLVELWGEFLHHRLDAVYRATANYYASPEFDCQAVRGTPLDICEHLFLLAISNLRPVLASADGRVLNIHEDIKDSGDHLFALVPPYRSADYVAAQAFDRINPDELQHLAGAFFEPWSGEPDQPDLWAAAFPCLESDVETLPSEIEETLRFTRLPICFERERFLVVEQLPSWTRFLTHTRNSETIVSNFAGRSICIPDNEKSAWDDILSGKAPLLDDALGTRKPKVAGRPRKREIAAAAYFDLGLNQGSLRFKVKLKMVERQVGFSLSESTLRRAVRADKAQDSSD